MHYALCMRQCGFDSCGFDICGIDSCICDGVVVCDGVMVCWRDGRNEGIGRNEKGCRVLIDGGCRDAGYRGMRVRIE